MSGAVAHAMSAARRRPTDSSLWFGKEQGPMNKTQRLPGWSIVSRGRLLMAVTVALAVATATAASASPMVVSATQNPAVQSYFTLDFGFPGGMSSAQVADTTFELEVDPSAGSARFLSYHQNVAPLTLPGGVSTGDITVEIVTSLGGTFDRATGEFTTNDVYAVHFTGDLSAFGIESPFILPSSSTATVQYDAVNEGTTVQEWRGGGVLAGMMFTYECSVSGSFTSSNTSAYVTVTEPASGAVDARQPHALNDATQVQGWDTIVISFNAAPTTAVTADDLLVTEWGSDGTPPTITDIETLADDTIRLTLDQPVAGGAWTVVTHIDSGTSVCIAALPGDVNGDNVTSPADILGVIDCINGVAGHSCELTRADVDRSGMISPADIVGVVDLLNGAGAFEAWNGATLGPSPCG